MMKDLSQGIVNFLERQGYVIVSSIDSGGAIHCSAKGIGAIEKTGKVYLIDLYLARTFENLKRNPAVSITAVDEHQFIGYTLKGTAKIVARKDIEALLLSQWDDKVTRRISRRLIKNVKEDRKSLHHPESRFPHPQYLIEMDVAEIVDLAPPHLKETP
jgi:general stress protein 26